MNKTIIKEEEKTQEEEKLTSGSKLKLFREERGYSLQSVHEATKIPMDVLRAIEEGYTVRTLSPFYFKGFLKIYANYLNVDINEIIEDYHQEQLPQHIKSDDGDFGLDAKLTKYLSRERKRQMVIVGGMIVSLIVLFNLLTLILNRSKSNIKKGKVNSTRVIPPPAREETRVQKSHQVTKTAQPVKPVKMQPKVSKPKKIVPAVVGKNITLTVRAQKNSWLRVKTDDDIVFQSTLKAGMVETWVANKEIEIAGRNISSLEFELNGKTIGTLGRDDRRAKKVIITKDGLKVDK